MPRVREEDVSPSASGVAELERLIEEELLRRLQDPEAAAELPAHSLARLYDSVTKAKKPEDGTETDEVTQDVLEIVANTQLPEDRKRELIETELGLLEDRRLLLEEALEGEDG